MKNDMNFELSFEIWNDQDSAMINMFLKLKKEIHS